MTSYALEKPFSNSDPIGIDKAEADSIREASEFLLAISSLEDLFALIAHSYIDFEKFLFDESLVNFTSGFSENEPIENRFTLVKDRANQKFLVLTNAYRALCDQGPQRLKNAEAHYPDITDKFQTMKSKFFDNSLEFRIFDFLRNSGIHHELPIDSLLFAGSTLYEDHTKLDASCHVRRETIEIEIKASKITQSKRGRSATKTEVEKIGFHKIDLKVIIRTAVASLFKLRKDFYSEVEGRFSAAEDIFSSAFQTYEKSSGERPDLIELNAIDDEHVTRICPLKMIFPDLVRQQQKRFAGLQSINSGYPTIEVTKRIHSYQGQGQKLWKR